MTSTIIGSPPTSPTSYKKGDSEYHHYQHDEQSIQQGQESAYVPQAPLLSEPPVPTTRTKLGKIREAIREPMGEFMGVAILVMFGCAGACQSTLSSDPAVASTPKGDWFSIALGWGFGLGFGGWVSGGVSGGHINPALTLVMATWRGFPWRKVPAYIFAQLMGGIFGAALVYAIYYQAINIFEGGTGIRTLRTAGFFGTYAIDYINNAGAFFSEFLGTFLLVLMILATTDPRNGPPPAGLLPIVLFLTLFALGVCFGSQTGQVYSFRNQYWIWCPVMAPFLGAQAAAIMYDSFIYQSEDSPMTRLFYSRRRNSRSKAGNESSNHV
ncbi:aquaporin-like protein [Hymenopellis radicata]|nr:aquaporin-like protein [Hymenopellis radicata]